MARFSRRQKQQLDKLWTRTVQNSEKNENGHVVVDFEELNKKVDKIMGSSPNGLSNMMNHLLKELNKKDTTD